MPAMSVCGGQDLCRCVFDLQRRLAVVGLRSVVGTVLLIAAVVIGGAAAVWDSGVANAATTQADGGRAATSQPASGADAGAAETAATSRPAEPNAALRYEFARLVALAGPWRLGDVRGAAQSDAVLVTIEPAAAVPVIVARLRPGTADERLLVFSLQADGLWLTLFDADGRQVRLRLNEREDDKTKHYFEFVALLGGEPERDSYTRGLTIGFVDERHLRWSFVRFESGRKSAVETLNLVRAAATTAGGSHKPR